MNLFKFVTAMAARAVRRLAETVSEKVVDDIYRCSFMKQTGVSLKYMMDFGSYPSEKNLLYSSHFLHKELPVRLAHRVTELENLPYGLSTKAPVLKVCVTFSLRLAFSLSKYLAV